MTVSRKEILELSQKTGIDRSIIRQWIKIEGEEIALNKLQVAMSQQNIKQNTVRKHFAGKNRLVR